MGPSSSKEKTKNKDEDASNLNESNTVKSIVLRGKKRDSLNKEEKYKFKFSEIPISKLASYSKYTDSVVQS